MSKHAKTLEGYAYTSNPLGQASIEYPPLIGSIQYKSTIDNIPTSSLVNPRSDSIEQTVANVLNDKDQMTLQFPPKSDGTLEQI